MKLNIKQAKNFMKTYYGWGTFLVLVFIILVFILVIKAFVSSIHNGDVGITIATSFAGAFFAFLFIRIETIFEKIYQRQVLHYNALVKIEHDANRILGSLHQKIFVIDSFLDTIKETKDTNQALICTNKIKPLIYDKSVLLELSNIDLVNQLFGFFTELEKFNESTETVMDSYNGYKYSFINKLLPAGWFIESTIKLEEKFVTARKFAEELIKENKEIYGITRELLKKKPFLVLFMAMISKRTITEKDKEGGKLEEVILEEEIEKTYKESKERIDSVLKRQ
ncbi:MAG: hypothetical protein NT068_01840 [Candidatus Nomurabacteria bacterium]|nr:hypothetical protein [Candidatus Nomurabacteria bacterium]